MNIKREIVERQENVKECIAGGECIGWYHDTGMDENGRFKAAFFYKEEGWELDD